MSLGTIPVEFTLGLFDALAVFTDKTWRAFNVQAGIVNTSVVFTNITIGTIGIAEAHLDAVTHDAPLARRTVVVTVALLALADIADTVLSRRAVVIVQAGVMYALATFAVIAGLTGHVLARVVVDAVSVFTAVVRTGTIGMVYTLGCVDTLTVDTTELIRTVCVGPAFGRIYAPAIDAAVTLGTIPITPTFSEVDTGSIITNVAGRAILVTEAFRRIDTTAVYAAVTQLTVIIRPAFRRVFTSAVYAAVTVGAISIVATLTDENAKTIVATILVRTITIGLTFADEIAERVDANKVVRTIGIAIALRAETGRAHPVSAGFEGRAIRLITAIACLAVGRSQAVTIQAAAALIAITINLAVGPVGDTMTSDTNFARITIL